MNNWQNEFMAEYHRQDILEEAEHIRLEKLVLQPRANCPNLFERTLFTFANWMISRGKQLRKRYTRSSPVDEASTVNCSNSPAGSFAN
jgi:hypothetical protein